MKFLYILIIQSLILPLYGYAAVSVVTTTPDLAWAVKKIGQKHVKVESLLSGREDPHYADAVPSFIFKVKDADLICYMGLDLESGWLPKVLARASVSNDKLCDFGEQIDAIDVPQGEIDRSMGDVHAHGNPHFHLSPTHLANGAKASLLKLQELRPELKTIFQKNYNDLVVELEALRKEMLERLAPYQEKIKIIQYHKEYSYFIFTYKLQSFGALEHKPGVPPSAARITQAANKAREDGVNIVLAAYTSPSRILSKFEELTKIKIVKAPLGMIKGEHKDYKDLQSSLVDEILSHVK